MRGGLPHSDIHGSTPARGSPWLFAACHVLHRLLVPRHPPNALLILDIPAWPIKTKPHHAQKPSSGYKDGIWKYCVFRTQHDRLRRPSRRVACATRRKIHPIQSFIAPLNPRCPTVGASSTQHEQITIPGQTSRLNNGTLTPSEDRPRITRAQRRTRT